MSRNWLLRFGRVTLLLAILGFFASSAHLLQAQESAIIHYHRPDGAYAGWGLQVYDAATHEPRWDAPLPPNGDDPFGVYWVVPLQPDLLELRFAIQRGDVKDPGVELTLDLAVAREAWLVTHTPQLFTEPVDPADIVTGLAEIPEPAPPAQPASPFSDRSTPGEAQLALDSGFSWWQALIDAGDKASTRSYRLRVGDDGIGPRPDVPTGASGHVREIDEQGWHLFPFLRAGLWNVVALDNAGVTVFAREHAGGLAIIACNTTPSVQRPILTLDAQVEWVDPFGADGIAADRTGAFVMEAAPLSCRMWLGTTAK